MAGLKFSMLKSLCDTIPSALKLQSFQSCKSYTNLTGHANRCLVGGPYGFIPGNCIRNELKLAGILGTAPSCSFVDSRCYTTKPISMFSPGLSNLSYRSAIPLFSASPVLSHRFYSSSGGKIDKPGDIDVSVASGGSDSHVGTTDASVSDWTTNIKDAWQSVVEVVSHTGQKAKEVSDELNPHIQQLFDSYPYLKEVVVPVGYTMGGTLLAWLVMPRILRKFHKISTQSPVALLSRSMSEEEIPYEKSFWGALEDPVRYMTAFMAFSQISAMVAPTTIASQYITPAWQGAFIISLVWFLHRWKTNLITHALSARSLAGADRESILILDRISSVGLFVVGLMAVAEACGVAVQSVLTVGGIGGVATAFAARDVLGNVLSGLSMQLSKPFSLGDTIKAGSIEGQVVEMGWTTTSLLSAEKFPVIVPNSLFSSQVIVNKSRAQWRAMAAKIPLKLNDLDKIPQISNDITSMLKSNPKVFLGREAPYCFLSRVESSFAELTLGYNLNHMRKDELYSAEQDILLQAIHIIQQHGASVGSDWNTQ